jgi:ATP-dependent DNA helicase RecG
MKGPEKDAVMAAFAAGRIAVLVATTVIEVGVDVPNATLMIIEGADRFGLAQLHQLRGRVGRGEGKSVCLLLRGEGLSETSRARLALMRETNDGFRIAEEDLRLRGSGEILGTRQSGEAQFRLASPEQISELIPIATDDARLLIDRDGGLTGTRGQAARVLLYLFERDAAVNLLRSGSHASPLTVSSESRRCPDHVSTRSKRRVGVVTGFSQPPRSRASSCPGSAAPAPRPPARSRTWPP